MSRARRVVMTTDTVGGVFGYSLDLCRELACEELEIVLVSLGPGPSPAQREEIAQLEGCQLLELGGRLEWMDDAWHDVDRTGRQLLELAGEVGAELLHLNGFAHAALPFEAPRLVVAHSCVLSWWRAVKGTAAPRRYDEYRRRVRAGLAGASVVVAPTAAMLRALCFEYGSGFRGTVIPNGAEPRRFPVGAKSPSLCSMGRFWDAGKNLEGLARAARVLPYPLQVIGDLQPPDGCEQAAAELPNVRALGRMSRDQAAGVLARCAVYVHPARYEPFGLSVLEAALAGCALVLADIPSLRELWQGAAEFVPCDDPALCAVLARLLEDPARCREAGARARARARHYSLARFGAAYRALYGRLTGRAVGAARRPAAFSFHSSRLAEGAPCASSASTIR